MTKYWKITNHWERHYGLKYQDGRVDDKLPFNSNPKESCVPGGIYYTTSKYIFNFFHYGPYIRKVTFPKFAMRLRDPQKDKWRANSVILGPRREWMDVKVLKELIADGAEPTHDQLNNILHDVVVTRGKFDVAEYMVKKLGARFYPYDITRVVRTNKTKMAKLMIENGGDINLDSGQPLAMAVDGMFLTMIKFLLKNGAKVTSRHFSIVKAWEDFRARQPHKNKRIDEKLSKIKQMLLLYLITAQSRKG